MKKECLTLKQKRKYKKTVKTAKKMIEEERTLKLEASWISLLELVRLVSSSSSLSHSRRVCKRFFSVHIYVLLLDWKCDDGNKNMSNGSYMRNHNSRKLNEQTGENEPEALTCLVLLNVLMLPVRAIWLYIYTQRISFSLSNILAHTHTHFTRATFAMHWYTTHLLHSWLKYIGTCHQQNQMNKERWEMKWGKPWEHHTLSPTNHLFLNILFFPEWFLPWQGITNSAPVREIVEILNEMRRGKRTKQEKKKKKMRE